MNGELLPMRHGYPLRVLIPGRYGEENPKWLTRIELTDHFVSGLYSDQGWYYGPLHITSRIDRPTGTISVNQPVQVAGVAYGGSNGIGRVEVSTDGGTTWNTANLEPPLSKDAWVLWNWQWTPATKGQYTLTVRCIDGTGALQISKQQNTVPGGGEGYHRVQVTVK
jgi:DMSO/TMAO reductase YedYZ molybdopterin-dependent catalytic subunit